MAIHCNAPWESVGTGNYAAGSKVPISGTDFAAGKDTMYYSFIAKQGAYADTITTSVIANEPSFLFKKTGVLSLGSASLGGMNLLTNGSVKADDANAVLSISGNSLNLKGGTAWAVNGKSILFVPSTVDLYNKNNSTETINAYNNGTPTAVADPSQGNGVYIFKMVNGPASSDVFYGMIGVTKIVPGVSVDYEYRIGSTYKHLSVIK